MDLGLSSDFIMCLNQNHASFVFDQDGSNTVEAQFRRPSAEYGQTQFKFKRTLFSIVCAVLMSVCGVNLCARKCTLVSAHEFWQLSP